MTQTPGIGSPLADGMHVPVEQGHGRGSYVKVESTTSTSKGQYPKVKANNLKSQIVGLAVLSGIAIAAVACVSPFLAIVVGGVVMGVFAYGVFKG